MAKLTLEKKDCTALQGSWLGTLRDERGRVVEQIWRKTGKELEEWFADRQTAANMRESAPEWQHPQPPAIPGPASKEEADAIEKAGGSPSSLTWPPKPPVIGAGPTVGVEATPEEVPAEAASEETPATEEAPAAEEDETNETTAARKRGGKSRR
jgi:hypothetical protein